MTYPLAVLPPSGDIDPRVGQMERLTVRARWHVLHGFTPQMPLFLYKYFASIQPYSLQNLRDVIVGSMLQLNSPSDFKDPRDCPVGQYCRRLAIGLSGRTARDHRRTPAQVAPCARGDRAASRDQNWPR
jgi:hypothetical protein